MSFKAGDVVECTSGYTSRLTKGEWYVIQDIIPDGYKDPWIRVKDNHGEIEGWKEHFFKRVKDLTKLEKVIYNIDLSKE